MRSSALGTRFGVDRERIDAAVDAWAREGSDGAAAELHLAAEPRRQELFRRLNLAPGGTAALVSMREQLMDALVHRDDIPALVAQSQKRSAVFDILTNPTAVTVEVA